MAKAISAKIKLVSSAIPGSITSPRELAHDDREAEGEEARPDRESTSNSSKANRSASAIRTAKKQGALAAPFSFPFTLSDAQDRAWRVNRRSIFSEKDHWPEQSHEEATRIASRPVEPHYKLRRCGEPGNP